MEAVHFESSANRYVISLDKQAINQDVMLRMIEWLNVESLAQKAGVDDESLEQLADEIKADWWAKNKHRFIPTA